MRYKFSSARALAWFTAGIPVLLACALFSGLLGGAAGSYLVFSADLPKIPDLEAYRPKTVSTFYAEDGSVIGLFYKQKRFPLPLDSIPTKVRDAFLAAEDARFFTHPGVDVFGVVRALIKNVTEGGYHQGGSTITQQVTRNFLLSPDKKIARKIREVILSVRLEKTLSKQRILELYLNEIYMGAGSFGVEAAARTYFGKTTKDLTVAEAALLAGIVQSPNRLSLHKNLEGALKRREFVLGQMLKHAFITEAEFKEASASAPAIVDSQPNPYERVPYFAETARHYILSKYGENKLYNEGLQVWTTCDVKLQKAAADSLLKGGALWEKRQARPAGLVKRLKPAEAKEFLASTSDHTYKVGDYIQAVVLANHSAPQAQKKGKTAKPEDQLQDCALALQGNRQFRMTLVSVIKYKPNDVVQFRVTDVQNGQTVLDHDTMPAVQGAVVCVENNTGYVRALVGGMDFERSNFNRATQAMRQPGSAFKPFVFAAALEWGMYSPNTVIIDDPIAVQVGKDEQWLPANADNRFQGPLTLRQGLAHSRNIVAVKLLMDVGFDKAIEMAKLSGLSCHMGNNLSLALGASEVSPLELTSAYTVFPNMGVRAKPVLVKKVVDRFGKVLEDNTVEPLNPAERMIEDQPELFAKQNEQAVEQPAAGQSQENTEDSEEEEEDQQGQQEGSQYVAPITEQPLPYDPNQPGAQAFPRVNAPVPGISTHRALPVKLESLTAPMPRVMTPQTAYLMLSMMRDVCVSGTAATVAKMKRRDLTGKTGTTDDCSDAWFVGSNPVYTTGVWIGHDTKTSLGKQEHGGTAALPVWMDFMNAALVNSPAGAYPTPAGVVFLDSGVYSGGVRKDALLEASPDFAPSPELKQVCRIDMDYATTPGLNDPYTGAPMLMSSGPQADQVRVLSVTGQTLGYGFYSRDQRGRPTVYAANPAFPEPSQEPVRPNPNPEIAQNDSAWSSAGSALQNLPKFLAPYLPDGWIQ
jgi:penicillin-binding protein 1A